MKAITLTQNVNWLHNRLIEEGIYNHPNVQHDFLATCKGEYYGETDKYFFKHVHGVYAFKEVRIFKASKRVTVSQYQTTKKQPKQ